MTKKETMLKYFKPPFYYDGVSFIYDSDNQMVMEMRGYGHISSSLNYDDNEACKQQDIIAEYLVECMNKGIEEV